MKADSLDVLLIKKKSNDKYFRSEILLNNCISTWNTHTSKLQNRL